LYFVRRDGEEEITVLVESHRKQNSRRQGAFVVVVLGLLRSDLHGAGCTFQNVEFLTMLPQGTNVHALRAPGQNDVIVQERTCNVIFGTLTRVLPRRAARHGSVIGTAAACQH